MDAKKLADRSNGIYSQKSMTYAEFAKLEFWCPLCGSPVHVGSVDVTSERDPKPMVRVGRYECTRRGCEHGPPVVPGCECDDCEDRR